MKKRILSIFLIVCLCAAFLPTFAAAEDDWEENLWICGTRVTAANAADVLNNGGTVSYDRENHTLTLNNAEISTTGQNAIVISKDVQVFSSRLTINLIGENTIYVENTNAAIYSSPIMGAFQGLTLFGTGSLEIKCEGHYNGNVNGIGINISYGAPSDGNPALIIDGVTLKISTCDIEAQIRGWGENYGIKLSRTSTDGYDICIKNGAQVTVTTGAAKCQGGVGNNSYGIWAKSILVDGANTKLTATAGEAEGNGPQSYGIYIYHADTDSKSGMMSVTDGASVTATGGKAATSYGVYLHNKSGITVDNASLLAQTTQEAGEDVVLGALNKAPTLTFTNGYDWRTAASGAFTPSANTEYKYAAEQTYVEIKPAEQEPEEEPDEQPEGVGGLVAILDDVPFVDVDFNDYFYDSVKWAYHSGVTGGTDAWHFSPDAGCTRAQAVTFLWRAAGSPSASYLGSFSDVDADAYYAPAVAWAVANGVTNGTSATTFSPEAACSRGDIVTFLYRAFGGVSNGYHPFTDVPASAYYADAVAWAYEHSVTGGTSADTFSPADACSRAQIVTFLYRVLG